MYPSWLRLTWILLLLGAAEAKLAGQSPLPAPQQVPPAPFTEANGTFTLERLESLADQYNPLLRRGQAQIEASRGSALQAGIWSNPRFDTNNPQVIAGRSTALNAGFQQEIPVMGKKRLDQAAANEVARQTEFSYLQDRFALMAAIRQQFYAVLVDQQRIRVLSEMVQVASRSHDIGQKRLKAGEINRTDVLLLLIDLQRVQANLRSAQAILDGDLKQLSAIVGIPSLVIRLAWGQLIGNYPDFPEEQIRRFVSSAHTQILIAHSVIEQNKHLLRRAEVEVYPNPYMGPATQFGPAQGSQQFWFNIQFNIPVWDRNQGNIRAARANLSAAFENVDNIRNNLWNQGANLLSQYHAALEVVRQFENGILPNTRETVRLTQDGYAKGLTDFNTFLQSQRTLVQASSDYVDALQNLWNNATQLAGLLQLEKFP